MKHLLLVLFLLFLGYALWNIADKRERSMAARLIGKHTLRLALLVFVVVALLAVAMYFPSASIF